MWLWRIFFLCWHCCFIVILSVLVEQNEKFIKNREKREGKQSTGISLSPSTRIKCRRLKSGLWEERGGRVKCLKGSQPDTQCPGQAIYADKQEQLPPFQGTTVQLGAEERSHRRTCHLGASDDFDTVSYSILASKLGLDGGFVQHWEMSWVLGLQRGQGGLCPTWRPVTRSVSQQSSRDAS